MMAGRIRWAVEGLELSGGEQVLEVGPGHGVAVELCADSVGDGHVVGVDRSAKMIAASGQRNRHHLEAGRVTLIEGTVETAAPGLSALAPFDRVLAIRVRAFIDEPEITLMPLVPLLAPGAEVHLVFDSPSGDDLDGSARKMERIFSQQGFRPGETEYSQDEEFTAVRVVGRAPY